MPETRLYAFWDLQVCTVDFAAINFLYLAETERLAKGCESIVLVILPGPRDGFRDDTTEYGPEAKKWRLRNIVWAGTALFPSIAEIHQVTDRDRGRSLFEQAEHLFPRDYHIDAPTVCYGEDNIVMDHLDGRDMPSLTVGGQALAYVRTWLDRVAEGRKVVTLTLREDTILTARNSNTAAWGDFARHLHDRGYLPVAIRDTDRVFEPTPPELDGVRDFAPASVNLEVRAAVYQLAHVNMIINTGPATLCFLNDRCRFAISKMVTWEIGNTRPPFLEMQGYHIGKPRIGSTELQWVTWENDDLDSLVRCFEEMERRIAAQDAPAAPPLEKYIEPPLEVAKRFHRIKSYDHAEKAYLLALQESPDDPDRLRLLGTLYHDAKDYPKAIDHLTRALAAAGPDPDTLARLGDILFETGNYEAAVGWNKRAWDMDPTRSESLRQLGDALRFSGDFERALQCYSQVLQMVPDDPEVMTAAADMAAACGNRALAASLYGRIRALRSGNSPRTG